MVELCSMVLTGKDEQRDICSIGLKTVAIELPSSMGLAAMRQLTPRLVSGVRQDTLEVRARARLRAARVIGASGRGIISGAVPPWGHHR